MNSDQIVKDFFAIARRVETEDIIKERIRALSDREFDNLVEELKTWGFLTFDDIQKINKDI